jgi:glycine/D-amino acid oxidase-like deaminating enzyme
MANQTADVVVIGGGVNGCSTAFHLAERGATRVILVERRHLGAGASGKSGSLVRMHYTNSHESRLAHESLKYFHDWKHRVGGDCGFERLGYLKLVARGHRDRLARNVAAQQAIGIKTRVITPEEVREIFPECRLDDIGGAAYEPDSGYADPNATTFSLAEAARRRGVEIRTHCEATRIVTERGRVIGVDTTTGRIDTPAVVLVPGAWAHTLLEPLGISLPLQPFRIQVSIFRWPAGFTRRHCVISDDTHQAWIRPEGAASTLIGVELGVSHGDPEKYSESVDPDYVTLCREKLSARLPAFAEATMRGGWAGMIMMSQDGRAIIDQIPSVAGLWVMLGDSGTSFKTSPAIGRCLAEWVTDGKPALMDLTPFRASRFAEGKPWVDADNYGRERLTVSR